MKDLPHESGASEPHDSVQTADPLTAHDEVEFVV
ncbi:MAG: hypothetical protein RIT02_415 [Planctomycetota bacterium]|jgi:hypothetical protein